MCVCVCVCVCVYVCACVGNVFSNAALSIGQSKQRVSEALGVLQDGFIASSIDKEKIRKTAVEDVENVRP